MPTSTSQNLLAEVVCPQCTQNVDVPVSDWEVELKVRPYAAAFGEHSVVCCSRGHKFWVYYC